MFVVFPADSKMLLTACDDMHSNLYDVHSGDLIDSFSGGVEALVTVLCFNPAAGVATALTGCEHQL